jgi:hypothetical protein
MAIDRKLNISNVRLHRRTFEGKTDESKNNSAITSKYMTSYKYAVSYDIEGYMHNPSVDTFVGKKDALSHIDWLKTEYNIMEENKNA